MSRCISFLPLFLAGQISPKNQTNSQSFCVMKHCRFRRGQRTSTNQAEEVRSRSMSSDEEIQKQIDELAAPIQRRSAQLRFILKMTIQG